MNNDISAARWQQVREQTRTWWGKLTEDDLEWIGGKAQPRLAHMLQEKYGYIQQHAESQSNRWMRDHQDSELLPSSSRRRDRQYDCHAALSLLH